MIKFFASSIVLFLFVNIYSIFGQANNGWIERELTFTEFYTIVGGYFEDDGSEWNFLGSFMDELREPMTINSLYDDDGIIEIIIEFNVRDGQNVNIHFYFHGNLNGQYVLETTQRGYLVHFYDCMGFFLAGTSSEDENMFSFVLYSDIAKTKDDRYILFWINKSLLF